jgi:hypothetical protein
MSSNEWYTPSKYIEAAREVMGSIDLDPASCELANQTVRASKYYTEQENGLIKPWYGRVWLNPPFSTTMKQFENSWQGQSVASMFMKKLMEEYRKGNVTQAMLLAKADPKQNWFHRLWRYPICFAYDRVYFNRPVGNPCRHQFGTCFIYLGSNEQKFIDVFCKFGTIAKAVDIPLQGIQTPELWEAIS